jgi:hypothetical protein
MKQYPCLNHLHRLGVWMLRELVLGEEGVVEVDSVWTSLSPFGLFVDQLPSCLIGFRIIKWEESGAILQSRESGM